MSMAKTARLMIDDIQKIKEGTKKLPKTFYDVEEYETDQWLKINGMADMIHYADGARMWRFPDESALLDEDYVGYNVILGKGIINSTVEYLFSQQAVEA